MCDIIYAGSSAKFSQPEIKLGTIPGGGGTQRLTLAVGKSNAMEMILTGRHISAAEAEKIGTHSYDWTFSFIYFASSYTAPGLVGKVFPPGDLVEESLKLAREISQFSLPVIMMCKEAVSMAFEVPLSKGLDFERRLFHSTFALVPLSPRTGSAYL